MFTIISIYLVIVIVSMILRSSKVSQYENGFTRFIYNVTDPVFDFIIYKVPFVRKNISVYPAIFVIVVLLILMIMFRCLH